MKKIPPPRREQVEATKRRAMTPARRDRIFKAKGGVCYICKRSLEGKPYDVEHPVALGLGGSDEDDDLYPVCPPDSPSGCHKIKTKIDKTAIAGAKRKGAKDRGEWRPSKTPLKSRSTFPAGRKLQSRNNLRKKK